MPKLITKPNRSALEHFAVRQDHRTDGIDRAGILVAGVEDARCTFCAVDGRVDYEADLVDEARAKEGAVRAPAALEQQALDPEFPVQDLERRPEIDLMLSGEEVGDAIVA